MDVLDQFVHLFSSLQLLFGYYFVKFAVQKFLLFLVVQFHRLQGSSLFVYGFAQELGNLLFFAFFKAFVYDYCLIILLKLYQLQQLILHLQHCPRKLQTLQAFSIGCFLDSLLCLLQLCIVLLIGYHAGFFNLLNCLFQALLPIVLKLRHSLIVILLHGLLLPAFAQSLSSLFLLSLLLLHFIQKPMNPFRVIDQQLSLILLLLLLHQFPQILDIERQYTAFLANHEGRVGIPHGRF